VNFLSHPVIVGFTNAAAIIIALSQVNKLIGVPIGRSEHFINDIWGVIRQLGETHWPTLAMGVAAIAIIGLARWKAPRMPGVLIAVVLTTLVSCRPASSAAPRPKSKTSWSRKSGCC